MAEKRQCQRGFTLMELLISIVIVSVIVSMMFAALRTGLSVWDKGERESLLIRRLQIVRKLMKNQTASICTEAVFETGGGATPEVFMLKGDETQVEFVSRYALIPDGSCELVYVKYYLVQENGRSDLMVMERTFCLVSEYEKYLKNEPGESPGMLLMEDIQDLKFEYLAYDKNGEFLTHPVWNSEDEPQKEFPGAVKIHLQVADFETNMIMRLMAR